jgi:hypothetical protein
VTGWLSRDISMAPKSLISNLLNFLFDPDQFLNNRIHANPCSYQLVDFLNVGSIHNFRMKPKSFVKQLI